MEKTTVQTTLEGKIEEKGHEYQESQEIIVRLKAQLNVWHDIRLVYRHITCYVIILF